MADAVEAFRQDVDQVSADELICRKPHDLHPIKEICETRVRFGYRRVCCSSSITEQISAPPERFNRTGTVDVLTLAI
uniref:Uncharacterized protein n=1 Tax=Yoonia rhodophyticola TaxID=3137370 RepID=A0AAN0M737_9RHOB